MNIAKEIAGLRRMTVTELRRKHVTLFGEENPSRHKEYLVKRIAWRMQALAEGGLSERAQRRAAELASDADLRTTFPTGPDVPTTPMPSVNALPFHSSADQRLPMPGAVITREYKGRTILVHVLPKGFEHEGTVYRTLSAVAKTITGTHWNGYHFFRLSRKKV